MLLVGDGKHRPEVYLNLHHQVVMQEIQLYIAIARRCGRAAESILYLHDANDARRLERLELVGDNP